MRQVNDHMPVEHWLLVARCRQADERRSVAGHTELGVANVEGRAVRKHDAKWLEGSSVKDVT